MVNISVILMEPKFTGNIGAVSRAMKNFGYHDLIMINPPKLDDEALCRAKHAYDVLESAKIYANLEEILPTFNMLIGTTGIDTKKEKEVLRRSEEPFAFAKDVSQFDGKIAILFGREDTGLYNHELALCDRLVTIPTSEEYPIMNLSHAVAVVLYTLYVEEVAATEDIEDEITENEKERVIELFELILQDIKYPDHKKEKTAVTLRRLLGRAKTSPWDYHRIMGVLSRTHKKLNE
ncbi:MAG: RNA methyltransferase [Thermoplasmata archaeon]